MKKLMRKLVLSSFALGLAVITLSTTTFAWYTTNKEVSATGIQGTTQGEVAGSLEIAKAVDGTWGPTVEITASDYLGGFDGTAMEPLQLVFAGGGSADGSLVTLNPNNVANGYAGSSAAAGSYIKFTLYVRNSTKVDKETNIYLKELTIKNKVENKDLPKKNQLVGEGIAGFDGKLGDSYQVDAVRALSMTFTSRENGTATYVGSNATRYSVGEYQDVLPGSNLIVDDADAVKYFNTVMNPNGDTDKDITKPSGYNESVVVKSGANAILVGTLSENSETYTEITFMIWLEGWDKLCFDACQGQSFDISLKLTSEIEDCLIGTN